MVVTDDNTDCFFLKGFFEDNARIDISGGEAAFTDPFAIYQAVGLVEIQDIEYLMRKVGEERLEVFGGGFAVFKDRLFRRQAGGAAPPEFKSRRYAAGLCLSESFDAQLQKVVYSAPGQGLETVPVLGKEIAGHLHCVLTAGALADEETEQLRIAEHFGALENQLLTRPVTFGPVLDGARFFRYGRRFGLHFSILNIILSIKAGK